MHVHRPAVPEKVEAPDLLQQLLPGEHLVGMGRQEIQHLQLLGRHVQRLSLIARLILRDADGQPGPGQRSARFLLRALGSAQHRPDPGGHLLAVKGLDDIVVRPQLQAQHLVKGFAPGRDHDHRNAAGLADRLQHLIAVHPRQHHIQQDQIRRQPPEFLHGRVPPVRLPNLKAFLFQVQPHQMPDIGIVIHHQHAGLILHHRFLLPASGAISASPPSRRPPPRRKRPAGSSSHAGSSAGPAECRRAAPLCPCRE